MLNNLTNFFNLIDARRLKTTPEPSDLIPLGTKDSKYDGGYKPTFMQMQDLLDYIGGNMDFCNIVLPNNVTINLGPVVNFAKRLGSDDVDEIIPLALTLNRGATGGIYNRDREIGYFPTSPADTEWNSIYTDPVNNGHGNLSNINDRIYGTWVEALDNQAGNVILSTPLVMRHIPTGRTWLFTFTDWGVGFGRDNFAYDRQEVTVAGELCSITYSDGTKQTSAAGVVTGSGDIVVDKNITPEGEVSYTISSVGSDANTWDVRNVAFLSTFGDDGTAVRGDGNKPFRTFSAAQADGAPIIFVKDGSWGTETLTSNRTYYFYPGTEIFRMRDGGATISNVKVLGYVKFRSFGYGIELTGSNSQIEVECESFDNVRSVVWADGANSEAIVTVRGNITSNGSNGGGYACRIGDGAKIVLNVEGSCITRHWLVTRGSGATTQSDFTINCRDIRISATSTYGNAFKALINDQGGGPAKWTVDLMGGKFTMENPTSTSAFGVPEGALTLYVNVGAAEQGSEFYFRNGEFDGNNHATIRASYIILNGSMNVDNAIVRSAGLMSVLLYHQATNAPGDVTLTANNSQFIGNHPNGCMQIGAGKNLYLNNCTLYNADVTSVVIIKYNNSNTGGGAPQIYMYNCNLELANNGLGELTDDAAGVMQYYISNTYSSEPINVGTAENWGGYTQIPGFVIPKF